jgi:hypothetical protein
MTTEEMFGKKTKPGPNVVDINKEREWLKNCRLEIQAHSTQRIQKNDLQIKIEESESVID